jgi:hypothetical protein
MMRTMFSSADRAARMAAFVAAPALIAILWIVALEGYRAVLPGSRLFTTPAPASLADAIRQQDIEGTFGFIRAGQDPNRSITITDATLTGGQTIRVSPLLLAVAARNGNAVRILLGFGARAELAPDVMAACLADRLGDVETAQLLRRTVAAVAAQPCSSSPDQPFPLLNYATH